MGSYLDEAKSDAQTTAQEFLDEIVESYVDNDGEASDDFLNDYSDSYHHENHVDKDYTLQEAAELLDDLSDYEETDSGLWQGLEPRRAISCQAAYTYGNAVMSLWADLIKEINDDSDLTDLMSEYEGVEDAVQTEWDEAEETYNAEQEGKEEPGVFEEPFDCQEEEDKRKDAIKEQIKKRIEEIVNAYN